MEEFVSLPDAAALTGIPYETLATRRKRGKLTCIERQAGKSKEWGILPEVLLGLLKEGANGSYAGLLQQWQDSLRVGTGYKRRVKETTIQDYQFALGNFWRRLRLKPSVERLSLENLKRAIDAIGVDDDKRACHQASKLKMYYAYRSFTRFLMAKGLRSKWDMDTTEAYPERIHRAKRPTMYKEHFLVLLASNENLCRGRKRGEFDMQLGKTVICLLGYTGMRPGEMLRLKVQDLEQQVIHIINGKGYKDRDVGIPAPLEAQLKVWMQHRPASDSDNLLLYWDGLPVTLKAVQLRFVRLSKRVGFKVTPYMLRSYFTTYLMEEEGFTLEELQDLLGHEDSRTTRRHYVRLNQRRVVEKHARLGRPLPAVTTQIEVSF